MVFKSFGDDFRLKDIDPITLDNLRFRAKTRPQIKGKQQSDEKLAPT